MGCFLPGSHDRELIMSHIPVIAAIPGVHGDHAWGTYFAVGTRVRVTVCTEDTVRGAYGAAAVGPSFDSGYRRHDIASAVTIGYHHTQCRATLARCASHLVVEALSGYKTARSADAEAHESLRTRFIFP